MQTSYRDHAIAKNRLLFKLTLLWAIATTFAVVALSILCFYALSHREVHWLPMCVENEFSLGESTYSPSYLKQMTEKVADLRLTYNPDTIDARYAMLTHLLPANTQESFKKLLDTEITTVHEKNISSVFYAENVAVDVVHHQGQIAGLLYRTSHGLQLNPQHKTYQIQFSFQQGILALNAMKEVSDATHQ